MSSSKITRSRFLRGGCGLAAGTMLGSVLGPGSALCAEQQRPAAQPGGKSRGGGEFGGLALRPYQLLCLVCAFGEDPAGPKQGKLRDVLEAIRKSPDMPITLRSNAGDVYVYQDPGTGEDTPEGRDFNRKRDLDVLQKLGLGYGSTMKAKDLFRLIFDKIPTTQEICKREGNTCRCVWWDACGESNVAKGKADYEKGRTELMAKLR